MEWMEIFTLVTGVIYIVLEIRQKNLMWLVGVATSLAAMWVFWGQGLYASFGLNVYYFAISFWGLYQWRKDARTMVSAGTGAGEAPAAAQGERIHLNKLSMKTVWVSLLCLAAGTALLMFILDFLNDPMSPLDAGVAVLSAIATFWLSRSYKEQWLLWIAADLLSTVLCLTQGLYWMSALYIMYTVAAGYGYIHWKRHGEYIQ